MSSGIKASLFFLLMLTGIGGAAAQSPSNHRRASGMEADVPKIKEAMLGNWESIAPEVRPSAGKNADGSLKPFYLKRAFKYLPSDRVELEIVNSADPTVPCRSRGSRSAGTCCGRARIRSLRARTRSISLPMRATKSLPSPRDL